MGLLEHSIKMPEAAEPAVHRNFENFTVAEAQLLGGVAHAGLIQPIGGRFAAGLPQHPRHVLRTASSQFGQCRCSFEEIPRVFQPAHERVGQPVGNIRMSCHGGV